MTLFGQPYCATAVPATLLNLVGIVQRRGRSSREQLFQTHIISNEMCTASVEDLQLFRRPTPTATPIASRKM